MCNNFEVSLIAFMAKCYYKSFYYLSKISRALFKFNKYAIRTTVMTKHSEIIILKVVYRPALFQFLSLSIRTYSVQVIISAVECQCVNAPLN